MNKKLQKHKNLLWKDHTIYICKYVNKNKNSQLNILKSAFINNHPSTYLKWKFSFHDPIEIPH